MTSQKPYEAGITLQSASDASNYRFEDSYKLVKKLSKGSFGIVYSSEHIGTHEEYAVKVIERAELNQKESNNVEREVSILHDFRDVGHIVQLVDFYVSPGKYYVVQQLAQGGDVFERLAQRTSYNEKDARDLAVHLLEAIDVLHSRKLAHRDLKPENLLLRDMFDDTAILVADFGFAAYVPPEGLKTRCGTPAFVAPQILVPDCRYDERVDMWSVGCLLYMLIAGYPPFQDRNHRGLFRKVRGADFVFHDKYWKNVSKSAKQLISCMLTIDPRYRCTARMALEKSNWLKMDASLLKEHDLAASLGEIKKFHARRTLKSAIHAVVWTVKYKNKSADDVMFENHEKGWDFMMNTKDMKGQAPQEDNLEGPIPAFDYRNDDFEDEKLYSRNGASDTILLTKLRPSVTFGDMYEVTDLLHDGQSSKVYECYHRKTREVFAVKIIDRNDSIKKSVSGRTLTETVLHEVALLDSLRHKNIIKVQEFFEDNDKYYLVMERMRGGDVFDRIMKETRYTERDARKLAKVFLEAVAHFHEHGIAHRDLKPQNLLIKTDNDLASIKIADFGFACRVHTPQSLTTRCGTPSYVAPEVLKNIPYDQSSDMWSVGVILFLLLSGSPPFVDDNQSELFRKIRTAEWKFRGDEWNNVSKDAKDLIKRLLVPNPLQRLTAAQALRCRWFRSKDNNVVSSKNAVPAAVSSSIKPALQSVANEPDWADNENGLQAVEQVLNRKEAEELKRMNELIRPNSIRRGEELNGKIELSKVLKTRTTGADDLNVRVSESKDESKSAKGDNNIDRKVEKLTGKDSETNEADDPALSSSNPANVVIHTQRTQNLKPEEYADSHSHPLNEGAAVRSLMKAANPQDGRKNLNSPRSPIRTKANGNDVQRTPGAINRLQRGDQASSLPVPSDANRLRGTNAISSATSSKSAENVARRASKPTNVIPGTPGHIDTNEIARTSRSAGNVTRPSQKQPPESAIASKTSDRKGIATSVQQRDVVTKSSEPNDNRPRMQGTSPVLAVSGIKLKDVGAQAQNQVENNGVATITTVPTDSSIRPSHKQLSESTRTSGVLAGPRQAVALPRSATVSNSPLPNSASLLQGSKSVAGANGGKSTDVVRHAYDPAIEQSKVQHQGQKIRGAARTSTSTDNDVKASNKPPFESKETSKSSDRLHQELKNGVAIRPIASADDHVNRSKVLAPESKQIDKDGGIAMADVVNQRQNIPAPDSGRRKSAQAPIDRVSAYENVTTDYIAQDKDFVETVNKTRPRNTADPRKVVATDVKTQLAPRSERSRLRRLSRVSKTDGAVEDFERLEI